MYSINYLYFKLIKKLRSFGSHNSFIHRTSKIESGTSFNDSSMDKHSFSGYDCCISNTEIGKYCSIGSNVIIGGGNHPLDWISTSPVFYEGRDSVKLKISKHKRPHPSKTIIENDVWIGDGVIIKQGIHIGNGAVIGFGSRVTKNVPDYAIVAGNPATIIKYRFNKLLVNQLLQIEWWNFPEEKLKLLANFTKNPNEFIDEIKNKL